MEPKGTSRFKKFKWLGWLLVGGVFGLIVGIGTLSTLHATDEANFCVQCHVMDEVAFTHQSSIHASQACNECHVSQSWYGYLPSKARLGLVDVYHNFLGTVPDTILVGSMSKDIIQENCIRCHSATVSTVNLDIKERCVDCHRQIPHKRSAPISLRKAADV